MYSITFDPNKRVVFYTLKYIINDSSLVYSCKTAANPYIIRILSCGYYRGITIVIIAYDEDVRLSI